MADIIKGLFGGGKAQQSPLSSADDDFADFAGVPDPSPVSIPISSPSFSPAKPSLGLATGPYPYTKWYRVWERASPSDFILEAIIIPVIAIVVLIHFWGKRRNQRTAHAWIKAHAPVLKKEFASVGFEGRKKDDELDDSELVDPAKLLKTKAFNEYTTYATGRQNVAFVDIRITLLKWYNPAVIAGENLVNLFFESLEATQERVQANLYCFDGKESQLAPGLAGKTPNSTFDGFVWAIVHKDAMRRLREGQYDLSLTTTKEHPKLPNWATIMTESAEITDTLLTPELIKAVEQAGDSLEALIISDQPIEQPTKLEELTSRKRVSINMRLPSSGDYAPTIPLFHYFLRLPDLLVSSARFRPEVMRRVKQTREEESRKIRKATEGEVAEERKMKADREKKEKRDAQLKNMSADEQRKFLEKEREKENRRKSKRQTMRG
ncbi:DUF1682-domain-containing protein [Eremomyces bilateralis CBS 781.70]|uniref:DUF1682-domain-containing protein n=1 Tax=Eremomyces bilateralis CBS 781.70 TaxID=1392243 RepID=A0A6G1GES0_9PEZI|nr:DUF1682-domain-containing protein [Eremomyces bilateralis CBS 781.70]KAF1816558.1 DUF1682-domain-containing protein [Eremomyces bilateralis CBS 781.70]